MTIPAAHGRWARLGAPDFTMNQTILRLRVRKIRDDALGVRVFELGDADDAELPAFAAGGHIDVHVNGLVRQYSLFNDPGERRRYMIAVARDPASRGGSQWLHEAVGEGDELLAGAPRNQFALKEDAGHSVLIAGGIGITPIWSMAQRLAALGRSWELHYAARDRSSAALLAEIAQAAPGRVRTYFSRAAEGERLDVGDAVWNAPPGSHFYCCGPQSMIEAFHAACEGLPPTMVHVEHFRSAAPAAADGGFTVVLARSGREIDVRPGETILDALGAANVGAVFSCREGVCGSCETTVLEGTPDHRDAVLSDAERSSGRMMMICCSGSLTERLVLDL